MTMNNDFLLYILVLSIVNTALSPIISGMGFFDEFLVVLILAYAINRRDFILSREVKFCIGIFIFYLIYSLAMAVNVKEATIRDFLICSKPFVCFYVAQYYGMDFSEKAVDRCRRIVKMMGVCLWIMAPFISQLYYNTTFYYPACAYTGMLYILLSKFTKKDWIIATLILAPGLLSIRAKFFAEFVIWLFLVFFLKHRLKFNFSFIIAGCVLCYIIFRINYEKIMMYTVNGIDGGAARTYMYITSLKVFEDYFPLGPGFGTFGTDSAAKYYSPLNYHYDLNNIWGLNPDDDSAGTSFYSDTFYPILAQFGIVGVILFVAFLKKRWNNINSLVNFELYKISIFLFLFLIIQCIAGNYFTSSDSLPVMLILGFLLSQKNNEMYSIE